MHTNSSSNERILVWPTFLEKLLLLAGEVTDLLSYVSLNLTAVRKILKKMAKHIKPEAPTPGYMSLDIRHPHNPGYRLVQVRTIRYRCFGAAMQI